MDGVKQEGWQRFIAKLWQRNYWEHIIRKEQEWTQICNYIQNNPAQWPSDKLNESPSNRLAGQQSESGVPEWMV